MPLGVLVFMPEIPIRNVRSLASRCWFHDNQAEAEAIRDQSDRKTARQEKVPPLPGRECKARQAYSAWQMGPWPSFAGTMRTKLALRAPSRIHGRKSHGIRGIGRRPRARRG